MDEFAKRFRWQDVVNLLLGLAIGACPWLLGDPEQMPLTTWNATIVGAAIVVLAAIDIDLPARWEEWAMAVLGAWLVVSTYVFGAFVNARLATALVVAGVGVAVCALWALFSAGAFDRGDRHAHGH